MIFIKPIQDTNHRTANQSQSSGFLVFSKNWADSLLDFSELIPSWSDQAAIKQIPAYTVPYLVYSDSYTTEDSSEISESLLARGVFTGGGKKPESDFSYCSQESQR